MKKNAIVDLIVNDLKDMQNLAETFREPSRIAMAFIDLLRQKHEGIAREIELLNYWASDTMGGTMGNAMAENAELVGEVKAQELKTPEVKETVVKETVVKESEPKPEVQEHAQVPVKEPAKEPTKAPEVKVPDYFADELSQMDDAFAQDTPKAEEQKPAAADEKPVFATETQTDSLAHTPADTPAYSPADTPIYTEQKAEPIVIMPELAIAAEEAVRAAEAVKDEEKPAEKAEEKPAAPVQPAQPVAQAPTPQQPVQQHRQQPSGSDIATYGSPVSDIRKAIGLNDQFLYIRKLFNGNSAQYNATLNHINAQTSLQAALASVRQTFAWDETEPEAEAFIKAIHRRFL